MTQTPKKIIYTARATVTGGREAGHVVSDDGLLDLTLTAPKEVGGPGSGTNPEQLFAAGYAACYQSALSMVAKKNGQDASESAVDAEVGFGPEGDSYALTVELAATIPGLDAATTQELMDAAHAVCPYSKATRGNVPVTLVARDG